MKKLILGLGNEILGDDAFGPVVAGLLKNSPVALTADITSCGASGLRLLDHMEGYEEVLILDSWLAPERQIGEIVRIVLTDSTGPLPGSSSHFWSFSQTLAAGRAMGMKLPARVTAICAVIHGYEFSDKGLSPELQKAAQTVLELVGKYF